MTLLMGDVLLIILTSILSLEYRGVQKKLILKYPDEDMDIRQFFRLPIYIQNDVLRGIVLYWRDMTELSDIAWETIKKFELFKTYLDEYTGVAPLSLTRKKPIRIE